MKKILTNVSNAMLAISAVIGIVMLVMIAVSLLSCDVPIVEPSSDPTAVPTATATLTPTATPAVTNTPIPTATPTDIPIPTATDIPATPTDIPATPTITPTPTPVEIVTIVVTHDINTVTIHGSAPIPAYHDDTVTHVINAYAVSTTKTSECLEAPNHIDCFHHYWYNDPDDGDPDTTWIQYKDINGKIVAHIREHFSNEWAIWEFDNSGDKTIAEYQDHCAIDGRRCYIY